MVRLALAAFTAVLMVTPPALAQQVKGKVTGVEGEGRTLTIDGKTKVAISNSGTKVRDGSNPKMAGSFSFQDRAGNIAQSDIFYLRDVSISDSTSAV